MQILHQAGDFLLAKLPQLEAGVTYLLSKSGDKVMLHRILQTGEVLSQEMNIPLVRSLLQAVDSTILQ